MSGTMDTFFEADAAERWKREINELVKKLKRVLDRIEEKVNEIGEDDSITQKWKQMGKDVQTAFGKLIECVKMIVTAIANIIKRMAQTFQEIEEKHDASRGNLMNT